MDEDEKNEAHWERGNRAAFVAMLGHCLRALSYETDPLIAMSRLVYEREQAIACLRVACDEHGDTDWTPDLALSDIIDKHLVRPWEDSEEDRAYARMGEDE